MSNPTRATVKSTVPKGTKTAEGLSILTAVCEAGTQCPEVQGSPVAAAALADLQSAVGVAGGSLAKKLNLATALLAAIKALGADYRLALVASRTYQTAVAGVANGDAIIISKAGLKTQLTTHAPAALEKVSVVNTKAGKHSMEAILSWPRAPGATGYAIEVNVTSMDPAGPWTALTSGAGRRRIVKGPTPGGQILARVASLGTDGAQSEWSDTVLCTTAF
jgi:hypothetical protein